MKQASIFDMFSKKKRKPDSNTQENDKPDHKRIMQVTPNKAVIIDVDTLVDLSTNVTSTNDQSLSMSPVLPLTNDSPVTDKSSCSDTSQCHDTTDFVFPLGNDKYSVECVLLTDGYDSPISWIDKFCGVLANAKSSAHVKAVVGVDCEWCPPWFRDNGPEKVCTIQLFCPMAGALVLGTAGVSSLPAALVDILKDPRILKVGVNIAGDGARLARDFKCPVLGLLDVAKGKRASLEGLCQQYCPVAFHVSKDSVESQVRLGNWAMWPLSELQVKYASMDAVVSYLIYLYQHGGTWEDRNKWKLPLVSGLKVDSAYPREDGGGEGHEEDEPSLCRNESTSSTHANFFMMQQNRSIVPPKRGVKVYPQGGEKALSGVVVVVSGVLDSMTRDELTDYVKKHGGKVGKSITKSTTHLVNDHGVIGPAKRKVCETQGIPIVGEDAILELVRKSMVPVV